jgi:type III restriction enzyme
LCCICTKRATATSCSWCIGITSSSKPSENFTDYKFEKYLFNPKGIKINGQNVEIRAVGSVADSSRNAINFMFFSTQLLYNRLNEDKENGLIFDDFVDNDVVILADEAHSLNVETRKKTKTEAVEVKNWETAVLSAMKAREGNMLLEFTATVDLANQAIHEKYQDKIVHRYDFLAFNKDGYSKDVKFLLQPRSSYRRPKAITDCKRRCVE